MSVRELLTNKQNVAIELVGYTREYIESAINHLDEIGVTIERTEMMKRGGPSHSTTSGKNNNRGLNMRISQHLLSPLGKYSPYNRYKAVRGVKRLMGQVQTAVAEIHNVSESVVDAVAEAEGVEPVELDIPLYEAIDPDALDRIFTATPTGDRMEGQVTFSYSGYEVTVAGDGYVSVEERDE